VDARILVMSLFAGDFLRPVMLDKGPMKIGVFLGK